MAVLRLGRFRTGPVGTGEMLTSHGALAPQSRVPFPGSPACSGQRPATGGGPVWRWDSLAGVAGGVAGAPGIQEPGAAFSPAKGVAVGYAEVVDA